MEVHHSHGVAHKKKWTEYLLEFLMLFLAVYLGFVAENYREHTIEGKREKQYMRYMVEDLDKDTAALNDAITRSETHLNKLDTASTILISKNLNDSLIRKLYDLNLTYLGNLSVYFTDRTSAQLKNAGAMRLIRSDEVFNQLYDYWKQADYISKLQNSLEEMRGHARQQTYQIFSNEYYLQNKNGDPLIADKPALITKEFTTLNELSNRLSHIKYFIQNVYVSTMKEEIARGIKLMEIIKKEYNLK